MKNAGKRCAAMKDNEKRTVRTCPVCGREYTGIPALDRTDNRTPICPDCGTRQALESIGVDAGEQEKILETIHKYSGNRGL